MVVKGKTRIFCGVGSQRDDLALFGRISKLRIIPFPFS
jgi:hypothetical protein